MSGWIGTLGALSEVLWKVSLSESTPAGFAFHYIRFHSTRIHS